ASVAAGLLPEIRDGASGRRGRPEDGELPFSRSTTGSPGLWGALPSHVDPEVLRALPQDVRAAALASYGSEDDRCLSLSPSAHGDGVFRHPPELTTPTRRGDARGMPTQTGGRENDAEAAPDQTNTAPAVEEDVSDGWEPG